MTAPTRSRRGTRGGAPFRRAAANRRGLATVWTLFFVVLLVTVLCVVVESAHLWLARVELENALEAAALSGVKDWVDRIGVEPSATTQGPRNTAVALAYANNVNGSPEVIQPNYLSGGSSNPNDNASLSGNLVFGAVSFNAPYVFNPDVKPQCERRQTVGAIVGRWEVQTQDTYGPSGSGGHPGFILDYQLFTPDPSYSGPAPVITKITYGLARQDGSGLGRFDQGSTAPPPPDEVLTPAPVTAPSGWGPVAFLWPAGAPPALTPRDADGTGRFKTLEIVPSSPIAPGAGEIRFGMDTDMMDGQIAPIRNTQDSGGAALFATSDFYITIEFNGQADSTVTIFGNDDGVHQAENQTFLNFGQAKKYELSILIPGSGAYGVLAQANISVTPWLSSFLGLPVGPFRVAARAVARAGCGTNPQLVHVESISGTQFPTPSP